MLPINIKNQNKFEMVAKFRGVDRHTLHFCLYKIMWSMTVADIRTYLHKLKKYVK